MKLSASDQESLVALLTRIYVDIRAIEEEFHLLAGEHDFRPRIEYFHDALRAFTSQDPKEREAGGRLSLEMLGYDLNCLRYLSSMPLSPFKPHGQTLSPRTGLMTTKQSLSVKPRRADRAVRERLTELYEHYAVLFAALLKPVADSDFKHRTKDLDQDVIDIHALVQQMEAMNQKKASPEQVEAAVAHLEDDALRTALAAFMQQQKFRKKDGVKKMIQYLKAHVAKKDKQIAAIEAAHLNYALAQLGIFENSKDLLKKMAGQGLNLIGKFVENAIAASRREMGR